LGVIIALADEQHSVRCTIRDLSDTSARIGVRGHQLLSSFHLIHIRDRLAYDAKVVWYKETEVGVLLKNTFRLSDISDPGLSHLVNFWLAHAGR
jgi:hypothetical protein